MIGQESQVLDILSSVQQTGEKVLVPRNLLKSFQTPLGEKKELLFFCIISTCTEWNLQLPYLPPTLSKSRRDQSIKTHKSNVTFKRSNRGIVAPSKASGLSVNNHMHPKPTHTPLRNNSLYQERNAHTRDMGSIVATSRSIKVFKFAFRLKNSAAFQPWFDYGLRRACGLDKVCLPLFKATEVRHFERLIVCSGDLLRGLSVGCVEG